MYSFKRFILNEALSLSQYRSVMSKVEKEYKERYKDWFNGKYRVYLDLDSGKDISQKTVLKAPQQIEKLISDKGYQIDDYEKGIASQKDGKRIMKIGKLIQSEIDKNPEIAKLKKLFDERLGGQREKASLDKSGRLAVISRHPYDIAGMSTNRGWHSCKELGKGCYANEIPSEIKDGVLVAYEIDKSDMNIQKPSGRVLILPYLKTDEPDESVLVINPENYYGTVSKNFRTTVTKWLKDKQGYVESGYYTASPHAFDSGRTYVDTNLTKLYVDNNGNYNFENGYHDDEDGRVDYANMDILNLGEEIIGADVHNMNLPDEFYFHYIGKLNERGLTTLPIDDPDDFRGLSVEIDSLTDVYYSASIRKLAFHLEENALVKNSEFGEALQYLIESCHKVKPFGGFTIQTYYNEFKSRMAYRTKKDELLDVLTDFSPYQEDWDEFEKLLTEDTTPGKEYTNSERKVLKAFVEIVADLFGIYSDSQSVKLSESWADDQMAVYTESSRVDNSQLLYQIAIGVQRHSGNLQHIDRHFNLPDIENQIASNIYKSYGISQLEKEWWPVIGEYEYDSCLIVLLKHYMNR